jgi:hypothetical protein
VNIVAKVVDWRIGGAIRSVWLNDGRIRRRSIAAVGVACVPYGSVRGGTVGASAVIVSSDFATRAADIGPCITAGV